jgi:thioredoxin reductase (NADPH)
VDDILIVGAGPAGLAVALQLQRYKLVPRLFEQSRPGGLLWNANRVENYPGFLGGIPGPDLARAMLDQIGEVKITPEAVIELTWEEGIFYAKTLTGTYQARVAVIASGTKPCRLAGFSIPDELQTCVVYEIADLLGVSRKRFIVVGSGDAAFDYAINLARSNSVIILNRGDRVKCLPRLWSKAQACKNISYRSGTAITRLVVCPEGGMFVECSSPEGQIEFPADYVVGAIGREPQLDFVSAGLFERLAEFEKRGILHLVGDVKNGIFRQAAIAVGDGIRTGMRIYQVLKENAHESDCYDG